MQRQKNHYFISRFGQRIHGAAHGVQYARSRQKMLTGNGHAVPFADTFGTGHSSTAISAAVGMAEADALSGKECWTVAVVGDGALTGGLSYEGLNNVRNDLRLVIIINENEMSISPNTGRLAGQLSRMRASRSYLRIKEIASAMYLSAAAFSNPAILPSAPRLSSKQ